MDTGQAEERKRGKVHAHCAMSLRRVKQGGAVEREIVTFSRVNTLSASSVLGVVVHEHVVRDGENVAVHAYFGQYDDLQ